MYETKLEFPGEGRFNKNTFVGEVEIFSEASRYLKNMHFMSLTMLVFKMFITTVCVIFLIKVKTKSLYDHIFYNTGLEIRKNTYILMFEWSVIYFPFSTIICFKQNLQFQKISILPLQNRLEFPWGRGLCRTKTFKEMCEA